MGAAALRTRLGVLLRRRAGPELAGGAPEQQKTACCHLSAGEREAQYSSLAVQRNRTVAGV